MLCKTLSLVNRHDGNASGTVLRCNMWTCEHCRPFKQRRLKRIAKAGEPTSFITITSAKGIDDDQDEAARELVRAWRLVVKRAKRKYGLKSLPYLAVIEATKAGRPHLHIVARLDWLPQKWLSAMFKELIGAPVVWIERVRGKGKLSAYIAKYIGKEPHHFAGCKRFWRSLDWIKDREQWLEDNKKSPGVWTVANVRLSILATAFLRAGYALTYTGDDFFTAEAGGKPTDDSEQGKWWLRWARG